MRYLLTGLIFALTTTACEEQQDEFLNSAPQPAAQAAMAPPGNVGTVDAPTPDPVSRPAALPTEPVTTAVPSHGELGSSVPVDLVPADTTEYFVRARRRMNLDQLQAQVAHATGGRQWIENNKNQFEELAATLGRPDYVSTLFEDVSAGPVFQKFLGDAARSICTKMANEEAELAADERILLKHVANDDTVESNPEAIDTNLAQLMLRFHGLSVPTDAPVLSKYRWLFQSVSHSTGEPLQGWRVVCIALMSHPRFYSY